MSDPETVTGAPGAQSHVPGQDRNTESAAGVAPGAGQLEGALDADAPAEDSLDGSGDSLGDDATPPGSGEDTASETDSAARG